MQAIILAGGKGTRLRPYTTVLPKPLMPVGDRPVLAIVLNQLKRAGATKATLAVNHMAELIMSFFGQGEKFGLEIAYSQEDKPLSTVGPIKLIPNLPGTFLVMNGDILTDLDYAALYRSHLASGAVLSVATYRRDVGIDFGVLKVDHTQRLTGFEEKPTFHFDVSMGIYIFDRSVLEYVPSNELYGFDRLVLDLLAAKKFVNTYRHTGYWLDLGRPDDYDSANEDPRALAIAANKDTRSLALAVKEERHACKN